MRRLRYRCAGASCEPATRFRSQPCVQAHDAQDDPAHVAGVLVWPPCPRNTKAACRVNGTVGCCESMACWSAAQCHCIRHAAISYERARAPSRGMSHGLVGVLCRHPVNLLFQLSRRCLPNSWQADGWYSWLHYTTDALPSERGIRVPVYAKAREVTWMGQPKLAEGRCAIASEGRPLRSDRLSRVRAEPAREDPYPNGSRPMFCISSDAMFYSGRPAEEG